MNPLNEELCPHISVAICTYNRVNRLQKTIQALSNQSLPQSQFEILVIDNASTDDTQIIVKQTQTHLPNLHYIYEPVQGLSRARNTAMQAAKAPYISYLDDDAIPCQRWVEEILNTFLTITPTPVGIGGPIYPLWETASPIWMDPEMEFLFSILDYGDQPHWLQFPKFPFGANVSYQRESLIQSGGFKESLGRKGKQLLSCEEYLVNRTLTKAGGRFYYVPQASVEHWIPANRTQTRWLLQRSYWQGRSEAVVDSFVGKSRQRQLWDSISKLFQGRRLRNLVTTDAKVNIANRAWLQRRWGYLSHVWTHRAIDCFKDP